MTATRRNEGFWLPMGGETPPPSELCARCGRTAPVTESCRCVAEDDRTALAGFARRVQEARRKRQQQRRGEA